MIREKYQKEFQHINIINVQEPKQPVQQPVQQTIQKPVEQKLVQKAVNNQFNKSQLNNQFNKNPLNNNLFNQFQKIKQLKAIKILIINQLLKNQN